MARLCRQALFEQGQETESRRGFSAERVRQVLQRDRRVAKFDFAPRPQGGLGVTIAEFS